MNRYVVAPLCAALLAASPAEAQPRRAPREDPVEAEAREHFRRGVDRTDEGQFDAAMSEFNAAWELTHNPRLLYNLAVTHEARGDAASALATLERFAREAPPRAVEAQRADLESARARLRERVATVVLALDVPGVEMRIDGALITPEAAREGVLVNLGRRRITVTAPGWHPYERVVDLASGAREVIRDGMTRVTSTVMVESDVPDAEVLIDGSHVATTPMEAPATVPEGTHTVEVRRAGYTPFSRVVEARGVGVRMRADLAWAQLEDAAAARLVVRASEAAVVVSLDGRRIPSDGSERVPPGRHRMTVATDRFLPMEREVTLAPGATHEERVTLVPTPAYRAEYTAEAARARRTADWVFWPGVSLLVGGVTTLAVSAVASSNAEGRYDAAYARYVGCMRDGTCDLSLTRSLIDQKNAAADESDLYRGVAIAGGAVAAVGLGAIVVGAVLRTRAPRIDRFPRVAFGASPGGVSLGLSGSF